MTWKRIPYRRAVQDIEDPRDIVEPRREDVFNLWANPSDHVARAAHLTEDVTQADLTKYTDAQIEGRLNYYLRQYTFERSFQGRREFKQEIQRTKVELNRRKLYTRTEADRVFAL